MSKENYANAYTEVLIILNHLIKEDYEKIPKEYIEFLTINSNNEHEFYYDPFKTLDEQIVLDETKYILFGLFEEFGATNLQKEKIIAFRKNYYNKLEEEKKQKYKSNDIFKKVEKNETIILIEEKETFFTKLRKIILKILKRKGKNK